MANVEEASDAGRSKDQRVEPSVVVYIAGYGRSGSTLLERILGSLPGWVNVGELNDMFRRMARYDELCGCGEPFSRCPFWTRVGDRAFGGWSPQLIEEGARLQRQAARQRHLMAMLAPSVLSGRSYQQSRKRYAEIHSRLYAAVLAESGAEVVVDASKGAAQALAVAADPHVDMRIIHLVRDARGVAFSWAKSDVQRPHGSGPRSTMHRFSPVETALRWSMLQMEIALARTVVTSSTRVRYEDLVAQPRKVVGAAVQALGLLADLGQLPGTGGLVNLPVSHGLSGNPSRFRSGPQQLRPDDQWRQDMPSAQRVATTAIAAPALLRYGYLLRSRAGSS